MWHQDLRSYYGCNNYIFFIIGSSSESGFLPFGTERETFVDDANFVLQTDFDITLFERIHEKEDLYVC